MCTAKRIDIDKDRTQPQRRHCKHQEDAMKNVRTLTLFAVLLLTLSSLAAYAQITPSGDAYTNTATPTTNYGAKPLLDVESASQTTYIQFDLSAIPSGYTSANITKATLKLYVNSVTTAGSFNVDFVNGTWAESKIDASNAPALGSTIAASVPLTTADKNQYILIDITSAVGAWLNGTDPNDGIALVGNSPLNATFDSKENTTTSHPPELDIVFAGGGTLTGVTTAGGSGLTGGGTSGTLNLALTNACATNQVLQWNGSSWACASVGTGTITGVAHGTYLTGGGTSGNVTLDLDTTKVPLLGTANIFAGTQTVGSGDLAINVGNLDLPQTGGGNVGVVTVGGAPFIHACCATSSGNTSIGLSAGAFNAGSKNNTATGYQVLTNTVGGNNTGSGYQALVSNGKGHDNTTVGYQSLYQNTGGNLNTAVGSSAGFTNTTVGSNNTLIGAGADVQVDGLTFATAIGSNAIVNESNALVLGGTGANAVKVGIGTAAPSYTLDVQGTGNFTGLVTFAPGQSFPGSVGSVTAGTDLTNTGTSSNPILNVDTTKVVTGVIAGTDLTSSGTSGNVTLNVDTTKVPQLAANNTFTGNQTVNGNLSATGVVSGAVFNIGSTQILSISPGTFNLYAGQAAGQGAGANNTGSQNTAAGYQTLFLNTTGSYNSVFGASALYSNTTGNSNTAVGNIALNANSTGGDNTAVGEGAMPFNTTGSQNTANGAQSLYSNTTGGGNTGVGLNALFSNTTGGTNTANGDGALYGNTTGSNNIASGFFAGGSADSSAITGSNNTLLGTKTALSTGTLNNAAAIGASAQVAQSNAMVLGSINGVNGATASTNVGIGITSPTYLLHIGNMGGASYYNFLRVEGPTQLGTGGMVASFGGYGHFGIDAVGVPGGRFLVWENGVVTIGCGFTCVSNIFTIGQGKGHAIADGWDTYSSRRWKTNIQTLHGALAKVEQLRGVSYDLKETGKHEVGVIAEEVGAVVPEIVSWDKNGKDAQGVDYSRLTALLIEATKEQQGLIRKQQQQIATQEMQMKAQQAQIETQHTQMQAQQSQLAFLASQLTSIQTSLNAGHARSSEVQRVNAQRPTMRQ
jgi:hypothetical protein